MAKAEKAEEQDEPDEQEVDPEQRDDETLSQEQNNQTEPDVLENQVADQPDDQDKPVEQAFPQDSAEKQMEKEKISDEQKTEEKDEEMMDVETEREEKEDGGVFEKKDRPEPNVHTQQEGEERGGGTMESSEETSVSVGSRERETEEPKEVKVDDGAVQSDEPRPLMGEIPAQPSIVADKPHPLMEKIPTQPRPLMESISAPVGNKPRPLMEMKPSQVTSDYHSASDTPRDENLVTMVTESHAGAIVNGEMSSTAVSVEGEGTKEVSGMESLSFLLTESSSFHPRNFIRCNSLDHRPLPLWLVCALPCTRPSHSHLYTLSLSLSPRCRESERRRRNVVDADTTSQLSKMRWNLRRSLRTKIKLKLSKSM